VGNLILNSGRIDAQYRWVIESPAPGIIDRQSVFEPLQTGVMSIDSMVPIGRGQRELIVGDRQTGKTSIGVDTILNQKYEKVFCVYLPLGAKASSILEVFLALVRRDAIIYSSFLVASAASSACSQFLAAYTGSALSEFFSLVGELPSFLIYDDLSRHAVAYREIYLLLRRPPGREAYPGEIFFVHSRLLERGAKLSTNLGGGSVTAFPVIETLAADVSAYITTNVISITDGQIFLSMDLFLRGVKPAIDLALSVTRVGSAAQWVGMKLVAGSYKLELVQFIELQSFSQFAADLGEETKNRLARGRTLLEMLKQSSGSPMNLGTQIGILSLANQEVVKALAIEDLRVFLNLYLSVPSWVLLFLPGRLVGESLLSVIA
jgi:F-type H+-transporting ATPase subunit alpha